MDRLTDLLIHRYYSISNQFVGKCKFMFSKPQKYKWFEMTILCSNGQCKIGYLLFIQGFKVFFSNAAQNTIFLKRWDILIRDLGKKYVFINFFAKKVI